MLYDNNQWLSDIDQVSSVIPELHGIAGKSIMITGAAGLVCSSVVDILFRYNDTHNIPIQILAAGRWPEKMEKRFGGLVKRPDFHFILYDAEKAVNNIGVHADFIIHGASNAYPALVVKEPVETMLSNFLGIKCLLDYAKENNTKRVLYISSSEIYGEIPGDEPYKEGQYGSIDILNPRNAYSVGKCAAEALCSSYAAEYHVEPLIVRPGHIYGPTASPLDTRVSSAWAFQAAKGKDIIMKSDGSQIRSYVYCLDCASAILKVLLSGKASHAYNISNPNSIVNIKTIGRMLAKAGGVKLKMEKASEDEIKSFNPMNNSSLESQRLLDLGWRGCFNAEEGSEHTVKILKEIYGY